MKRGLLLVVLAVVAGVAAGQTAQCWLARVTYNGTPYTGTTFVLAAQAVCGPHADASDTAQFDYSCLPETVSCSNNNAPASGQGSSCTYTRRRLCPGCSPANQDITQAGTALPFIGSVQDTCPGCDENFNGVGETFTSSNDVSAGNTSYCNTASQCKMEVTSAVGANGVTIHTVKHTTEDCASGDTPKSNDSLEDGETCTAVGDGEYCASPSGDGDCGYFNDTFVCLTRVKPQECKVLGDGGRLCGSQAAGTTAAPDSGTPGVPATPDGELELGPSSSAGAGGSTYNYYNSTTVTSSARTVTSDGGADLGGSPSGEEEAEESSCIGETCGEGTPELEDIGSMTEAFTGFWGDLQEVPIVAAAQDAAPSFGDATCPTWSDDFALYGETVEMNFSNGICTTWADVSPVLAFVALAFWGWLALRVLLSA